MKRRCRRHSVLQRDARHEHARLGLRINSGLQQPPRSDRFDQRRPNPAVAWSDAPGGEGSHHAIERSNNDIVYPHGFYGNFTREDVAASAAERAQAQAGGQAQGRGRGRAGVTNIRAARGNSAGWAVRVRTGTATPSPGAVDGAGHHVPARSGDRLRRISVRVPIHESREHLGAHQPRPLGQRPDANVAEELERDLRIKRSSCSRRVSVETWRSLCRHR